MWSYLCIWCPEYCQKYAKPEDVGATPDENMSMSEDDDEMSQDEYDSADDAVAGPVDP